MEQYNFSKQIGTGRLSTYHLTGSTFRLYGKTGENFQPNGTVKFFLKQTTHFIKEHGTSVVTQMVQ